MLGIARMSVERVERQLETATRKDGQVPDDRITHNRQAGLNCS